MPCLYEDRILNPTIAETPKTPSSLRFLRKCSTAFREECIREARKKTRPPTPDWKINLPASEGCG